MLLSLFCYTSQAQWSFGLQGGYTNAWEDYGDVGLPDDAQIDVNGFNVSGLAYRSLDQHFSIGLEPGYVQRGAACIPGWMPIFEGDTKFLLHYVEVPLMIASRLPVLGGKMEVFGKLGYGPSYLARAYREETPNSDDPVLLTRMDLKDENSILKRWDHGAYASLGFGFNIGNKQLFFSADFYTGMADAERFNRSKNRSINFNIGYLIK